MTKYTVLLFIVIQLMSTVEADSDVNWFRVTANTIIIADWAQTRYIADEMPGTEQNRVLGRAPTTGEVNRYFISYLLLTNMVAENLLPTRYKNHFYVGLAGVHGEAIRHNISVGVKFNF